MRKCPQCGEAYDDSWKVCLSCDVTLSDNPSIKETNPEIREKREEREKSRLPLSSNIFLSIVAIAVLLVPIILFLTLTLGGERYYGRKARAEFLENIDQKSKADILEDLRGTEEYLLNNLRDEEALTYFEELKKKSKQRMLSKP